MIESLNEALHIVDVTEEMGMPRISCLRDGGVSNGETSSTH